MFDRLFKWLNGLNPRQLLILAGVVMLVMFSSIYFFLSWWVADKEDEEKIIEEQPVVAEMRTVVTAKEDMPPLTIIKSEMLETKEVAENLVPEGAVGDIAEILNTSTKTKIFAGDVITVRKLLDDSEQLTFVKSIPADCRAVSISVNEITGVDGFAKPGDKVDLLLVETYENRSATASILLQDVLLLSINKNMNQKNSGSDEAKNTTSSAIENPSTATFALRPDEILKLISASKLGEIYLTLRPANPTVKYSETTGYTLNSINIEKKKKEETPQPVVPQQPQVAQVPAIPPQVETVPDVNKFEIIQGDQIVQGK